MTVFRDFISHLRWSYICLCNFGTHFTFFIRIFISFSFAFHTMLICHLRFAFKPTPRPSSSGQFYVLYIFFFAVQEPTPRNTRKKSKRKKNTTGKCRSRCHAFVFNSYIAPFVFACLFEKLECKIQPPTELPLLIKPYSCKHHRSHIHTYLLWHQLFLFSVFPPAYLLWLLCPRDCFSLLAFSVCAPEYFFYIYFTSFFINSFLFFFPFFLFLFFLLDVLNLCLALLTVGLFFVLYAFIVGRLAELCWLIRARRFISSD